MKYVCLGYMEEKKWDTMSESEREAFMEECFAYDAVLRKNGHFIGGEALQSARNATTLRSSSRLDLASQAPSANIIVFMGWGI